ncbi:MAG TPA: hypothetical protein VLK84_24900 [Longimicrobium sp.]|nr:hypothetical protein [Longimicrobium sp.]
MLAKLTDSVEALTVRFSWRRALFTIGIVATLFAGIAAWEWYTSYFRLRRLQATAEVLTQLSALDARQGKIDPKILAMRRIVGEELSATLRERSVRSLLPKEFPAPSSTTIWKILAGAAPWGILCLLMFRDEWARSRGKKPFDKDDETPAAFGLTLGFTLIAAMASAFVPVFYWPWGNLLIVPLATVLAPFAIGAAGMGVVVGGVLLGHAVTGWTLYTKKPIEPERRSSSPMRP